MRIVARHNIFGLSSTNSVNKALRIINRVVIVLGPMRPVENRYKNLSHIRQERSEWTKTMSALIKSRSLLKCETKWKWRKGCKSLPRLNKESKYWRGKNNLWQRSNWKRHLLSWRFDRYQRRSRLSWEKKVSQKISNERKLFLLKASPTLFNLGKLFQVFCTFSTDSSDYNGKL